MQYPEVCIYFSLKQTESEKLSGLVINFVSRRGFMSVITINGPVGSGAIEVGQLVAQQLSLTYVDRLVLAEAAKLVHAPVGVLLDKEQRVDRFRDRLGCFLQTM